MTEYKRARTRKPPAPKAEPKPAIAAAETGETRPVRRRRAKIGEHALKLKAPERPGYKRRFAIAKPERLAELGELGYTPVADATLPSTGLGSGTVQRPGGLGEDGSHYRHILMETPDELYAQGRDELERHNVKVDESIRRGRDNTGQLKDGETYGEGSITASRG